MKLYKAELNNWLEKYMTLDPLIKSILMRFVRSFFAGAFAVMITMITFTSQISDWRSLGAWTGALGLAGIIGGISGIVQAGDKYFRSINSEQ